MRFKVTRQMMDEMHRDGHITVPLTIEEVIVAMNEVDGVNYCHIEFAEGGFKVGVRLGDKYAWFTWALGEHERNRAEWERMTEVLRDE